MGVMQLLKVTQTLTISAVFIWVISIPAFASSKTPEVVVSIQPIALIAKELGGDEIHVHRLLPPSASPHDYPLKMSDHRLLRSADLVVWVGPALESFLAKIAEQRAAHTVITLSTLSGITFPAHHHSELASSGDEHHHSEEDPHIWLNPRNAITIANELATRFIQLAPEHKALIEKRLAIFVADVIQLDAKLERGLKPIKNRGFIVYHPGYEHFVGRYGLHQLDFVSFTPEQKAGAKHLYGLKALMGQAQCLFTEPFQAHARINEWSDKAGLRQEVLYPLGTDKTKTYVELLETMEGSFLNCLMP